MSGMQERVQRVRRLAKAKVPAAELMVDVLELLNWVHADRAHRGDDRGLGLERSEMVADGLIPADRARSGSSRTRSVAWSGSARRKRDHLGGVIVMATMLPREPRGNGRC
jgi:hypothetical protein